MRLNQKTTIFKKERERWRKKRGEFEITRLLLLFDILLVLLNCFMMLKEISYYSLSLFFRRKNSGCCWNFLSLNIYHFILVEFLESQQQQQQKKKQIEIINNNNNKNIYLSLPFYEFFFYLNLSLSLSFIILLFYS